MKRPLKKQSKLDGPINKVLDQMDEFGTDASEYDKALEQLERLMALQNTETWTARIDPNALIGALAGLGGILTIVAYEQKHVMVSKALGMLQRTKTP